MLVENRCPAEFQIRLAGDHKQDAEITRLAEHFSKLPAKGMERGAPDQSLMKTGQERAKALRCAIYTRVSTEHGLEQEFNSLDAQREACEAYILSQKHEGWTTLPRGYDDGGFSGLTVLDEEPYVAIEPATRTGIVGRMSGIVENFQLNTLLMDEFPRDEPRVSKEAVAVARGGRVARLGGRDGPAHPPPRRTPPTATPARCAPATRTGRCRRPPGRSPAARATGWSRPARPTACRR